MKKENIKFTERVSDVVALHNWDLTKAIFLGFALLKVEDKIEPVCLLVEPGKYKYHRMDGQEFEKQGVPQYEVIRHYKHMSKVFSYNNLFVIIKADKDCVYWEINSCGGVPDCYREKYAAMKAARF